MRFYDSSTQTAFALVGPSYSSTPSDHALRYGHALATGLTLQWRQREQVCIWAKAVSVGGREISKLCQIDIAATRRTQMECTQYGCSTRAQSCTGSKTAMASKKRSPTITAE